MGSEFVRAGVAGDLNGAAVEGVPPQAEDDVRRSARFRELNHERIEPEADVQAPSGQFDRHPESGQPALIPMLKNLSVQNARHPSDGEWVVVPSGLPPVLPRPHVEREHREWCPGVEDRLPGTRDRGDAEQAGQPAEEDAGQPRQRRVKNEIAIR